MTKTKGFLLGVLVFTLFPFASFAQDFTSPSQIGIEKPPTFFVYPNPIKETATIEFDQAGDKNWNIIRISIINLLGEVVYSTPNDYKFECSKNYSKPCTLEHKIDFRDQESGAYFAEVQAVNSRTEKNFRRTIKIIFNP